MKQSLSYLKDFRKEMIVGPFFKLLEAIFELFTPLIMAKLIDEGIPSSNTSLIYRYGFILMGLTIFGYIFSMICQYSAARAQEGYGNKLRNELFAHIQSLSLTQTAEFGTNSLITRVTSDINQMQLALAMFIRIATRAPFILMGSTIMAFVISPTLSLLFIATIPLIIYILTFVMRKTLPLYKKIQQKVDHLGMITLENLTGARVIRAFSKQEEQYNQFVDATEDIKQVSVMAGKVEALLNPWTFFIINAATFAVLYFGGIKINAGDLTQGEVIALVSYLSQILLSLVVLVNLSITFSKAYTSYVRVGAVFDVEPVAYAEDENVVEAIKDVAILFDDVTFKYADAKKPMLKNISFAVRKGGTLGIIGGTGAGKTTLIRLLSRLYDVTEGAIYIDGQNIDTISSEELHQKVDIVFQKAVLFRGTIAENLRYGHEHATDEELWYALELAEGKDFVEALPEGLETVVEQGGRNFSGGQRQRLTIARSFVGDPEIIVFDDTSSALDYITDSKLRQTIAGLNKTVITVSQRITAISQSDQIIVLNKGEVVGLGTHQELMKDSELYRDIAKSQLSKEEVEKLG